MKVFIKLLLFLLIVLPKVGSNVLILECQSNCNYISIDRFYYNNSYNEFKLIIERHNATIFLFYKANFFPSFVRRKNSNSKSKHCKDSKDCKTSKANKAGNDLGLSLGLNLGDYIARLVISSGDYIVKLRTSLGYNNNCNPFKNLPNRAERGSAAQISNFINAKASCQASNVDVVNFKVNKASVGYHADADADANAVLWLKYINSNSERSKECLFDKDKDCNDNKDCSDKASPSSSSKRCKDCIDCRAPRRLRKACKVPRKVCKDCIDYEAPRKVPRLKYCQSCKDQKDRKAHRAPCKAHKSNSGSISGYKDSKDCKDCYHNASKDCKDFIDSIDCSNKANSKSVKDCSDSAGKDRYDGRDSKDCYDRESHGYHTQRPKRLNARESWLLALRAQSDRSRNGMNNRRRSLGNDGHGLCRSKIVKGPVQGELGQGNPLLLYSIFNKIESNMFLYKLTMGNQLMIKRGLT